MVNSSLSTDTKRHTNGYVTTAGCKTQHEDEQYGYVEIDRNVDKVQSYFYKCDIIPLYCHLSVLITINLEGTFHKL